MKWRLSMGGGDRSQRGSLLIECLAAILIFSVGILAIANLQGTAVAVSTDAKYRSEAAILANALVGRMWASNRTQATLQANFANPTGSSTTTATGYLAWAWVGSGGGTAGTTASPQSGTVLGTLPVPSTNLPQVGITSVLTTVTPTSVVTVTITWQAPKDTTTHRYVLTTQIGG